MVQIQGIVFLSELHGRSLSFHRGTTQVYQLFIFDSLEVQSWTYIYTRMNHMKSYKTQMITFEVHGPRWYCGKSLRTWCAIRSCFFYIQLNQSSIIYIQIKKIITLSIIESKQPPSTVPQKGLNKQSTSKPCFFLSQN